MNKSVVSRANLIPRLSKTTLITLLLSASFFALACSNSKPAADSPASPASSPSSASSAAVLSTGGGAFEGIVTAKLFGGEKEGQMKFAVKDHFTRLETSAVKGNESIAGVMILDTKSGQQIMLMPQAKAYMTINLKEFGDQVKGGSEKMGGQEKGTDKMPKLTPTGKQETIAGYNCEHWLVGDDQSTDLCIAKGIGYFGFGNTGQDGGPLKALKNLNLDPSVSAQIESNPELKKFIEGGAFPLKISQIEKGQTKPIMEVTSVERKTLDDSLFIVPPDYKKMEIPGMPRGNR